MINLNEYIKVYQTSSFKEIIKQRLEEKYGHIPNFQKDEGYESVLISVYYELDDTKYFIKIIEELIHQYYEEKNLIALKNIQKLYIKFYTQITIKDIFPEKFEFNKNSALELDLITLRFLNIAKLRKEYFWRNCYFDILNDFQDSEYFIDLLLTIISGLNNYSILNSMDMWKKLYLTFANIGTDTSSLLIKIIINQWILANKFGLDKNEFIKNLSSIQQDKLNLLKLRNNQQFNEYLHYAINFLLKHDIKGEEQTILNSFLDYLNNLKSIKIKSQINNIIDKLLMNNPKLINNLILEKSNDYSLKKRNYMTNKTPATIMASM